MSPILCKAMRECLPDIITGLDAADELGEAAIQIVAGNVQAAVGPSPAEVGAHIKPGPIVGRRYDWRLLTGALVGRSDAQEQTRLFALAFRCYLAISKSGNCSSCQRKAPSGHRSGTSGAIARLQARLQP